jgi:hypothetical protein
MKIWIDEHRSYVTKNAVKILALLLLIDSIFLVLHVLLFVHVLDDPKFNVTLDRSYPEMFEYLMLSIAIICMGILAWKRRAPIYFGWLLLFVYLLLDNSLRFHELFSRAIVSFFSLKDIMGLRSQDLGEVLSYTMVGIPLTSFIAWEYYKSDNSDDREVSKYLPVLVLLLLFFAVGVDMIHSHFNENHFIESLLGLIEDGGELIAFTLIGAYSIGVLDALKSKRSPSELPE